MTTEVTIEVSDIHAEMIKQIRNTVDDSEVQSQTENFLHNFYQAVEKEKRKQRKLQEQQLQPQKQDDS